MGFDWRHHLGVEMGSGDGQLPLESFFQRGYSVWQGAGIHANPRFFKYEFQLWTPTMAVPDKDFSIDHVLIFRERSPRYSFAKAMERIKALDDAGTHMLIRSLGRKRTGPGTPWDTSRIPAYRLAVPYDDDPDPDFFGHR